jgi:hypothetical protein
VKRRGHRGEQHPEGEAAETEAGEDAEHPCEDDQPSVMENWLARGGILHEGKYNMVFGRRPNYDKGRSGSGEGQPVFVKRRIESVLTDKKHYGTFLRIVPVPAVNGVRPSGSSGA